MQIARGKNRLPQNLQNKDIQFVLSPFVSAVKTKNSLIVFKSNNFKRAIKKMAGNLY